MGSAVFSVGCIAYVAGSAWKGCNAHEWFEGTVVQAGPKQLKLIFSDDVHKTFAFGREELADHQRRYAKELADPANDTTFQNLVDEHGPEDAHLHLLADVTLGCARINAMAAVAADRCCSITTRSGRGRTVRVVASPAKRHSKPRTVRAARKTVIEKPPPVAQINGQDAWAIEAVVKTRRSKKHHTEYLVHWVGYGSEDDTWESEAQLTADLGEDAFGTLLDALRSAKTS